MFRPGAKGKWNYSNTDYTLLGMVLEAVTGVSAERQMADLFDEIGMDRSYSAPTPSEVRERPISELLIHGHMPAPPPSERQPAVLVGRSTGRALSTPWSATPERWRRCRPTRRRAARPWG